MLMVRFIGRYLEEIVASACLLVMCFATFANVVARYGANAPIPWAEELARYTFIWLVFVGAAVCTKHWRHIGVDAAVNLLPRLGKALCRIIADVGTAVLMAILIWYGTILALAATHPTSTLGIPTYLVYSVIPLSALSILIRTLIDVARGIIALREAPA